MPSLIDRSGQRFGRLVVTGREGSRGKRVLWGCECDCGSHVSVTSSDLVSGTGSCGCLRRDAAALNGRTSNLRHGMSNGPEYNSLQGARDRCRNQKHQAYESYGGRGIEYRLPEDMAEALRVLISAIGRRPADKTLDRIDNDGHYEIGNLRWATRSEQQRNKRNSRRAVPA